MTKNDDPVLLHRKISKLEEKIALQDECILQLKKQIDTLVNDQSWTVPAIFNLTGKESKIVSALYKANGRVLSRSQLYEVLYQIEDEPVDPQVVDVLVCRARKKLLSFNIPLINIRLRGYMFEPSAIDILSKYGKAHLKENEINIPIPAMV